jgi:hypothetical protein
MRDCADDLTDVSGPLNWHAGPSDRDRREPSMDLRRAVAALEAQRPGRGESAERSAGPDEGN